MRRPLFLVGAIVALSQIPAPAADPYRTWKRNDAEKLQSNFSLISLKTDEGIGVVVPPPKRPPVLQITLRIRNQNVDLRFVWILDENHPRGGFYLGTTEVPQHVYELVTGSNRSLMNPNHRGSASIVPWGGAALTPGYAATLPYDAVANLNEARDFVRQLSEADSRYSFRLPLDREWSLALLSNLPKIAKPRDLDSYVTAYPVVVPERPTQPVDECQRLEDRTTIPKPLVVNGENVYHMLGNVAEWCESETRLRGVRIGGHIRCGRKLYREGHQDKLYLMDVRWFGNWGIDHYGEANHGEDVYIHDYPEKRVPELLGIRLVYDPSR